MATKQDGYKRDNDSGVTPPRQYKSVIRHRGRKSEELLDNDCEARLNENFCRVLDKIYEIDPTAGGGSPFPAGGRTGQALVKKSDSDYDVEWDTIEEGEATGSGIPDGGNKGQALIKKSNADGDVEWANIDETQELPTGGEAGQVLRKKSDADGDTEWYALNYLDILPPNGEAGQVLTKLQGGKGAVRWENPKYPPNNVLLDHINGKEGQVLTYHRTEDDEFKALWKDVTVGDGNGVPKGGEPSQVLTKTGFDDDAYSWQDPNMLDENQILTPVGGKEGYVLTHHTDSEGSFMAQWKDVNSLVKSSSGGIPLISQDMFDNLQAFTEDTVYVEATGNEYLYPISCGGTNNIHLNVNTEYVEDNYKVGLEFNLQGCIDTDTHNISRRNISGLTRVLVNGAYGVKGIFNIKDITNASGQYPHEVEIYLDDSFPTPFLINSEDIVLFNVKWEYVYGENDESDEEAGRYYRKDKLVIKLENYYNVGVNSAGHDMNKVLISSRRLEGEWSSVSHHLDRYHLKNEKPIPVFIPQITPWNADALQNIYLQELDKYKNCKVYIDCSEYAQDFPDDFVPRVFIPLHCGDINDAEYLEMGITRNWEFTVETGEYALPLGFYFDSQERHIIHEGTQPDVIFPDGFPRELVVPSNTIWRFTVEEMMYNLPVYNEDENPRIPTKRKVIISNFEQIEKNQQVFKRSIEPETYITVLY